MRVLALVFVVGCIEPRITECGEWTCPVQMACGNAAEQCVMPDQLCREDATCGDSGFCQDGVCAASICGNGIVERGEVCDDDHCEDCTTPLVCGDGMRTSDEQCDDEDRESGDGCSSMCELETARWDPIVQLDALPGRAFIAGAYDEARRRFVTFGGTDGAASNQLAEYDVAGGAWIDRTTTGGPLRGYGSTMVYDPKLRVVVMFGGFNSAGYSSATWHWDGVRWEQQFVPGPPARAYGKAIYDPTRSTVVLHGGFSGSTPLGDVWEWDGTAWTAIPGAAPLFARRSVFAWDHARAEGIAFMPTGGTWRWRDGAWTVIANAASPSTSDDSSLVYDPDARQLVLHGIENTYAWTGESWIDLGIEHATRQRQVAFFDPVRRQVAVVGGYDVTQTPVRYHAGIAWMDRGASAWVEAPAVPGPGARTGAGVAYDPRRDRTLLYGGQGVGSTSNELWIRTDSTWRLVDAAADPIARIDPGFAYDAKRDVFVLYGGRSDATSVWEWNDSGWREIVTQAGPGVRLQPAMAYDARIEKVVLFGGRPASTPILDDTWTWDGVRWEDVSDSGSGTRPPRRYHGKLAFSLTQSELLLFGGTGESTTLGDFWKWDSGGWQRIDRAVAPDPRTDHLVVGDPWRREVIVFGGRNGADGRDDTWAWSGTEWRQLQVSAAPPPSYGNAGVYDPSAHALVMVGREGTWQLRWLSDLPYDVCETETDFDGDELAGCADPDCAPVCAP